MSEEDVNIKGYHHIFDPQCFKNALGETMVDLCTFQSSEVAKNAKKAVQQYYVHMLNNLSHQSKEFSKELVEHFGAFTGNNNEPYTMSNTASSHNRDHLRCFHQDLKDHHDLLCVVCPLGVFKGGQLVFSELKLIIHTKEGQAIAFRSNILVHSNLPVIAGIRHNSDIDTDISINVKNKKTRVSKNHAMQDRKLFKSSKLGSRSSKIKNSRRSHLANDGTPNDEKFLTLISHKIENPVSLDRIKMRLNKEYAEYIKKYNRYPYNAEFEISWHQEYYIL
ncbi:25778_t:CDS:2, partial [Gigaspora margarita]